MKVSRIVYHNVLGLEDLDVRPGKVTIIEGKNGAGKSSVIEPLLNLTEGGYDPTLKRKGAEDSELLFEVDDVQPYGKVTFRKNLMTGQLEARDANNKMVPKPKQVLDAIFDANSFNPASFLMASPKEKTRMLLDRLPRKVTPEDLAKIGVKPDDGINVAVLETHALPALAAVRETLFKTRHGVNQLVRQAKSAITDIERSLPAEQPGVDETLRQKRKAMEGFESEKLRKHASVKELLGTENATIKQACDDAIAGQEAAYRKDKAALEAQITELQKTLALKEQAFRGVVANCEAERDKQLAEAKVTANQAYSDFLSQHDPGGLIAEVATLEAAQKQQIRLEQSKEMIEQRRLECGENESRADRLTALLAGLDALEGKLLGDLPIAGLAYVDGELTKNGINIGRLNTAQQVGLSFSVARLGGSPFVVADGLECLDSETFAAFEKAAQRIPDVQFLVTRVTDGPLEVRKV